MPDDYDAMVVQDALDDLEAFQKSLDESLPADPMGMGEPSEEALASFFFHQQSLYPPQPFVLPDGSVVTASPWVLALGVCDNGKEWLARFERFRAKQGGA